jgi:hypothetical protein
MSDVSVVIPSLGGDQLKCTLESLEFGTLTPREIILVLPLGTTLNFGSKLPNLKILYSRDKNQVQQRLIGLRHAQCSLVLQLDDDIILKKDCLRELCESLDELGENSFVGPIFLDPKSNTPIHKIGSSYIDFAKSVYYFFVCGAPWGWRRMGKVSRAGIGFGVDPSLTTDYLFPVEWLPGACVLTRRQNLDLINRFPFQGKCFFEDLIYSHNRSLLGCSQVVVRGAEALEDAPSGEDFVDNAEKISIAHKYFIDLIGGSNIRFKLYWITNRVVRFIRRAVR